MKGINKLINALITFGTEERVEKNIFTKQKLLPYENTFKIYLI